jgi:hypothetical protein
VAIAGNRTGLKADVFARALERVDAYLLAAHVLEALIARRDAGRPHAADAAYAEALVAELGRHQADDGSWGHSLLRTAEALLLIRDLMPEPSGPGRVMAAAGLEWIRGRQNLPGVFGEGCSPGRHTLGLCHHFLSGFYSPAPRTTNLAGTTLANRAKFPSDNVARLGISCVALQAVSRWRAGDGKSAMHESALRSIVAGASTESASVITMAGYAAAVVALAETPPGPENDDAVVTGLDRLGSAQRADGSWPNADSFQVLDVIVRSRQLRYGAGSADAALVRAAGMLTLLQRPDGGWGREMGPERTLIGWRTLRAALEIVGAPAGDGAPA